MIAYNKNFLDNIAIVNRAKNWHARGLITPEQMARTMSSHGSDLHSPNIFVRTGTFIFTFFVVYALFGFFLYLAFSGSDHFNGSLLFLSVVFAAGCFIALEAFIKNRALYRSGADDALLYSGICFIFMAVSRIIDSDTSNGSLAILVIVFPFLVISALRYIDTMAALAGALCLYAIYFTALLNLGDVAKFIMPFAMMALSAALYLAAKRFKGIENLQHWENFFVTWEAVALIMFYAACNYFVIRESSTALFNMYQPGEEDISLAFLFYFLTAAIPLLYVYYGLKFKDRLSFRIGTLFIAAASMTFKHYFSLGHTEITLTAAGALMILIAYSAIRYLKTGRHGISFTKETDPDDFLKKSAFAWDTTQKLDA